MPDNNDLTGLDSSLLMASMSYIGVLVLVPIISGATKNPFIAFHTKQGLVILVGEILAIVAGIWISSLGGLLFVLMLIASIVGLFTSLHGERRYIPGVGTIADLFSL
ncbi:MAG: hypothetical protein A3C02_02630 [Candidatus Andersenbacteria bacterium RIFCSPHIGHO2_02_FULL_45_11]|uniref:DUF4870 domain-containing protein n=1 Tax=Candidatus Andersenbacteria bacterium RIFCSPHIGHO2_12_FULL_45_11 TaxID=1797281 RepID=A0A1G1X5G2_9BACT|nr:MAG: hypothetical protein A3C02_02630 [Candidatus Andersenbacteria bacterium RIFCSPHIGHO2_02_FULL_45_11]OGY35265.1 MAG: hypothetical protein A3D99_01190 [Candidatus Andersenbacteria bacterium RIFCSPHIGHO2_12_FULL_45_11]